MKKLVYIIVLTFVFSCDSENADDCFQKTGAIIQEEVLVDVFTKILVNRDIELVIEQGPTQKVIIETGENLINDVEAKVVENKLILTDNNSCNYVRNYGITKVHVTAPNITEIRSSTQFDIKSKGVLSYPSLVILSEDFGSPNTITSANFYLEIDTDTFRVVFNNLSNCFVSGKTNNLNITFAAGTSRFEGQNLIAQNVFVNNRSSNDIIVNPQQRLTGKISGTGNVISLNKPADINIQELYKGRLIFK